MNNPDPYRPQYHFSPLSNWMNDPNGLVYHRGEYHLFYQYHPGSSVWGPMHWGHAVSPDLVHWQHLPIALAPDDNGMIFSGSAVVDHANTAGFGDEALVAIFTHHREGREAQSLAFSRDQGRSWTKYPGNPVLLPTPGIIDFRDPKVFWYGEPGSGHWVLSLAAGDRILFYRSPDLFHWQPTGAFGAGFGSHGGVWETPDLFQLPVDGEPGSRWVLTVGIGDGGAAGGSATQYFIGHFNGETFISENPPDTTLWVDCGADYYAPQSFMDEPQGRRVMLGWLSNWQYARLTPTEDWRGVFSLPRELGLVRTPFGVRLTQNPVAEIRKLRSTEQHWQDKVIEHGTNILASVEGQAYEIETEFQVDARTEIFGFMVRAGDGEGTVIAYDRQQELLRVDRTRSGRVDFHPAFAAAHSAHLPPIDGRVQVHLYVDRFSVEVFGNSGLATISDSIFPSETSRGLSLFTDGAPVRLLRLDFYKLISAW